MSNLINIDYIGYITNKNGTAEYKEFAIDDYSDIVDELRSWANLGVVSIPNIRKVYKALFPPKFWGKGYCLDNEYGDVEYRVITNPLDILNTDFKIEYQERKVKINKEYSALKQQLVQTKKYEHIKFEKDRSRDIKLAEEELTKKYIEKFISAVENSMAAINYELTLLKLKSDPNVVAYSSDQKGWSNFNFLEISDEVGVKIRTNFCYGRSSYFIVTLVYKGIYIIPYSYLVTYYNARSVDIISGTRSFSRRRSSWKPALEYAVECANLARSNPKEFIRDFIINEVTELVSRLEDLVLKPKEAIEQMIRIKADSNSEIKLNHLNYSGMHLDRMLIEEIELPIAVMAFKVTDSIIYIESLKALSTDFIFLNEYIHKLVKLNKNILKKVEATKDAVDQSLPLYEEQVTNIETEIKRNHRLRQPYIDELNTLSSRVGTKQAKEEIQQDYIHDHPTYQKLLKDKDDLEMLLSSAMNRFKRREAFAQTLGKFIETISNLPC